MKTLILAAIRCSLMFTAVTASLFSVRPAQAYLVTLEQVGSNVVANGSGAINFNRIARPYYVVHHQPNPRKPGRYKHGGGNRYFDRKRLRCSFDRTD
jgi:hypothetical protein